MLMLMVEINNHYMIPIVHLSIGIKNNIKKNIE